MSRPNILLVVVDCARSDKWLGGGRTTRTPNLDRLAAQSAVLPTAIVEKPCTTPSFSTLLTGRYSPRHGVHLVWGYKLPESVPMLPESLAAAGYNTYAEATGPLLPEMGLARGFQQYDYRAPCDYLHTAWGDRFIERLKTGHYKAPWLIMLHVWELHEHRYIAPGFDKPEFGRDGYERAVSSLDAQLGRLFDAVPERTLVAFTGDHGEKTPAEEYRPGTAVDYSRRLLGVDDADGMSPFSIAQWAGPSVLQAFYGAAMPMMRDVRLKDRPAAVNFKRGSTWRDRLRLLRLTPFVWLTDLLALGKPLRLTQMLKKRGLLDEKKAKAKVDGLTRSLGPAQLLDMHMRMWINSYKCNMREGHMVHVYDFLVKVPLVLHWRGPAAESPLRPGFASDRMVRQPDIVPTLMDLVGVEPPVSDALDGRSFAALLRGEPWRPRDAFVSITGLPADLELRGVRTETHKFVYGPENDEMPIELYDLRADPVELRNIAAAEPRLVAELRAAADRFVDDGVVIDMATVEVSDQARIERQLRELGYLES